MAGLLVLIESNTTGTGRLFAKRAFDLGLVPKMICADPSRYPYLEELGIETVVCDTDSEAAVLASVRELGKADHLAGVMSSSDYFIATAAAVAHALGLPGADPEMMAAARSKHWQRERFKASGVGSPMFSATSSVHATLAAAKDIGLPVVVKPLSRSGSIGVRTCSSFDDVEAHAKVLFDTRFDERGRALPDTILVEEYLTGPEFSVEILGGAVCAIVAKRVDESVGFLEVGHDLPAAIDSETCEKLSDGAMAAVRALGLDGGVAHVELRVVADRCMVIEVNPRLAGGMIPDAIRIATGRDPIEGHVALAAGLAPKPWQQRAGFASIRFLIPDSAGQVIAVPESSELASMPGVERVAINTAVGRQVRRDGTFLDRLGHVIVSGESAAQAIERADRVLDLLHVEVRPSDLPAQP